MSEVVISIGASHSTLMHTHRKQPETEEKARRFEGALAEARDLIADTHPDSAIIVGSNHFRGFWLDLLPTFTIGVGECNSSGEAGTPKGSIEVDTLLARHIVNDVVPSGFDLAFSLRLQIDHGISHAVQYLLAGMDIPIVPVVVNVFAPPLPSFARCDALGRAIARAVERDGQDKRVIAIGSGGLSHHLPFPKWEHPETDGERFLVDAWLNGRGHWEDYDAKRRSLTVATEPRINSDTDSEFLDMIANGRFSELSTWSSEHMEEMAGNGGQEIRTWLIASAIGGHGGGRSLCYEAVPEWLTGMGVAVLSGEAGQVDKPILSHAGSDEGRGEPR